MNTDYAACYRDARTGLTALAGGLDETELTRPVPATPAWTVRDVVAHLVGIAADLLDGNLTGMGSDEWTAAQVDTRRDRPFADVLEEWDGRAAILEDQVAGWPPEFAAPLVGDLAVHDLDVRGAFGRTDGRDTPAARVAFVHYAHALGDRLDEAGLGAITLDAPEEALVVGTGGTHDAGAGAPLRAPPHPRRASQRGPDPRLRLGRRPGSRCWPSSPRTRCAKPRSRSRRPRLRRRRSTSTGSMGSPSPGPMG